MDFSRAKRAFAEDDPDDGLNHLQQACEKYLKGKLIEKGWKLNRTHDLPELLDEATKLGIAVPLSDETATMLAVEYLAGRYPTSATDPEPTPEQARACLDEVSKIFESKFP